ncbi:MAG: Ni/Fe-hydrogenase cytochrome b subunit [Polyangiaceae bacterium]|nr:Ni/Fe-hydrogenase cytochrome b subunit [Polyangiaceae bacterium]
MTPRQRVLKTLLWFVVGVWLVVTAVRFLRGLGATTGLTDATPWGLWIAFDVMAGVALAAGGFVLAATVYVFRLERFRPFARPAVLTAFLGYAAVAFGLLYDLGLPWNIWHPAFYPQPHSVLFEVAMCVMLYLTVLFLEFAPVILEHPRFGGPVLKAIHGALKKATIVLVVAGIVLSTLHQSSLGSLFLIAPFRLHPLWYSPNIWLLFFVSAVGLGLMMVTLESFFSAWFFGHRLRMDLLAGLGKAASVVLLLYATLRFGDLAYRGQLVRVLDGSPLSFLFLFEVALSAVVPGLLLAVPRVRQNPRGLGLAAGMTVLGVIGYRFDVCIVAFKRPDGMSYFPTWTELAVSVGIVAAALLVFLFFVENLNVYSEEVHPPADERALDIRRFNPGSVWPLTPDSLAAPRRHSLALALGVAGALAFLPSDALFGAQPVSTPVARPRVVEGYLAERPDGSGHELRIAPPGAVSASGTERVQVMLIDGNRDGRVVAFDHDVHVAKLGGNSTCVECHHENKPFAVNSGCHECHRDMYSTTDTFGHELHVAKLDGNRGCPRCHAQASGAKTRQTATPCDACHSDMLVAGARVPAPAHGTTGHASSYMDAMHGLCVPCHEEKVRDEPKTYPASFAECGGCHSDLDGRQLRQMPPYVAVLTGDERRTERRP